MYVQFLAGICGFSVGLSLLKKFMKRIDQRLKEAP